MNRLFLFIYFLITAVNAYPQDSLWHYVSSLPGENSLKGCGNRLYCTGYHNIFFTENEGKTWLQVYKLGDSLTLNYLVITPKNYFLIRYSNGLGMRQYATSTDLGVSWKSIKSDISFYTLDGDTAGNIWGLCTDGVFKTTNNGAYWEKITIANTPVSQIKISKLNDIYLVTANYIYYSGNSGASWEKLQAARDNRILHIDDSGILYAYMNNDGKDYGLYISKDKGKTWVKRSDKVGNKDLLFDKYGNCFGFIGISKDTAKTWELVLPPPYSDGSPVECIYNGVFYSGTNKGLFRYNYDYKMPGSPKVIYPLNTKNKWQYKYTESYTGAPANVYKVSLININIIADTIVAGKQYFKRSDYPNDWLRYSESDNKLYILKQGIDSVKINFNVPNGYPSNYYPEFYAGPVGTVKSGVEDVLGLTSPFFQIWEDFYHSTRVNKYNSQLGLTRDFYSYYSMGRGSGENVKTLMQAYIVEDGAAKFYGNTYSPEISITPPKILTDSLFQFSFKVSHPENVKIDSRIELSYIDSVYILGYYKKEDSIIGNIKLKAEYLLGTEVFSVDTSLSDNLLKQGYEFFFTVVAVDKSVAPKRSYAPATGYYSVKYNSSVDVKETGLKEPKDFCLDQNFPNPANPTCLISYGLPFESKVKMVLYNSVGQQMQILVDGIKSAGSHKLFFDGSALSSGIYFYNLQAGGFSQTKKLILMK